MNIQRFLAPTAREALAKARAAFGDDTLILSNRQLLEGVEVMAATESALAQLDGAMGEDAGFVAAPAAAVEVASPVARAAQVAQVAPVAPLAARTPDAGVQADTEQLAMSTLSFQDYVRERMLRRQHEATSTAAEAAEPQPARTAQAAPAAQPMQATPRTQSMQAAQAPQPAPQPTSQPIPQPQAFQPAPAPAPKPPAPALPNDPWETPTQTMPMELAPAAPDVLSELQAMKTLMDERFAALAWLGQARQDPIHSNLMLKLVRAGYSPSLARSLLEAMPAALEPVDAVRWLLESLEQKLSAGAAQPVQSIAEEGGMFALIGATGVGKTTSAAKLAAQGARLYGPGAVGLVTVDTQRAGAHDQLRAHARSLGMVAHLAHDRAALEELLVLLAGKKLVIVDTAGVAPHDPRRPELLNMLDMTPIKRVLVLNAGAHGDTLEDIAIAFKLGGTRQAIISKVDEAAKLGPVLDTLMRHEFAVRGVSNGQRVVEDWRVGNPRSLVRASLQAARRSAFDPRSNDLPCYFSPADCTA